MSAKNLRKIAKKEAEQLMCPISLKQSCLESVENEVEPDIYNVVHSHVDDNSCGNYSSSSDSESEDQQFNLCEELAKWTNNSVEKLLVEMRDDIKSLRDEVKDLKSAVDIKSLTDEVKELKSTVEKMQQEHLKQSTKLAQEVISVKLEVRKHRIVTDDDLEEVKKMPFLILGDLQSFDDELQKNEEKLEQFKQFIAKTGGEGQTQFLRSAIRKVFSDELASCWKGTSSKPSAEKCYLVKIIKNICYLKYQATDKEVNSILQNHFVHAQDRINKKRKTQ